MSTIGMPASQPKASYSDGRIAALQSRGCCDDLQGKDQRRPRT